MKGLLIKDLRITLQNKRLLTVILLLAVMLTFSKGEEGASFVISFITMICGTLVLNTISVDEFDKSIAFLMTMPIDKSLYAVEKYVFAIGSSLAGCMVSSIFCMLFMKFSNVEIICQAIFIFIILSLFQMILLPIQLKFGSEIGRIVLLGMVVCFVLLVTMIGKIGGDRLIGQIDEIFHQGIQWISSCNRFGIAAILSLIWTGCLWISVTVGKNIMKKKEF